MAEAASDSVAESWEGIESLSLSDRPQPESSQQAPAAVEAEAGVADVDKPATPPPAECSSSQPQQPAAEPDAQQAPVYEGIDAAIRQALADPIQRLIVYKCEELVEKFIADPCSPVLQFPANFSSYQRMLAHRVGQYYGLQTSTVDYEENQGRVVAVRTESCANPKPRLRLLDLRGDPIAMEVRTNTQPYRPLGPGPGHASASGADKPRLLRRQDDDRNMQGSSDNSMNPSPTRSMKERHEDYMKAREQLGLGSGPAQDGMTMGRGRGGPGGRYGPGALGGGRMDGGRGRKAVFRDKDKELNDPDYRRGMNRFSGAARFDPSYAPAAAGGMYQVPTYQTEFPTLGRMQSGPGTTGRGGPMGHMGQPMQPGPGQAHGAAPGQAMGMGPGGPMGLSVQHGAHGQGASWGQGVRPPPPPPPPHHVGGGNGSKGPMGQGGSGQGRNGGGGGGQQQGAASGQQGQQQQAVYGMAAVPYPGSPGMSMGVAQQFSVPMMAAAPGYVTAGPGQAVYGMTAAGQPNVIPAGALYAAPAPAGAAFYPAAVGIPGMAAGTYGYVAAGPAPGSPEAVTVAPGAFHPTAVYGGYPAGPAMYPATAQMTAHGGALHPTAGGGAMRPVYGVQYYQAYDASGGQYDGSGGQQGGGSRQSGDGHHPGREQQGGRNYSGGYGGGGGGGGGHYGGVRGGRDYEGGSSGRGDQQHQSSGAGGAAGGGHDRGK